MGGCGGSKGIKLAVQPMPRGRLAESELRRQVPGSLWRNLDAMSEWLVSLPDSEEPLGVCAGRRADQVWLGKD